ncbi:MAG: hypothetical protein ACK4UJ_00070 [Leptonema sp. (in: bacteria)]
MFKKVNFLVLVIFFESLLLIGFSILGLGSLLLNSSNSFFWIQILLFTFYFFVGILGIFSIIIKKYSSKLKKLFGICLMTLYIYFPFTVIMDVYVPILIYILTTTGIVLFLRNR